VQLQTTKVAHLSQVVLTYVVVAVSSTSSPCRHHEQTNTEEYTNYTIWVKQFHKQNIRKGRKNWSEQIKEWGLMTWQRCGIEVARAWHSHQSKPLGVEVDSVNMHFKRF
jgi:hypothetical protein